MAVLVEGISVLIQVSTIRERYPGGWPAFVKNAPNNTLCSDNELGRVGFMSPDDCKSFVGILETLGIVYLKDGRSQDSVIVDQMQGMAAPCDWADFGRIELQPGRVVSAAKLRVTKQREVFCPDGWTYKGSLSDQYGFVPTGREDKSLRFLRHENGLDFFLNLLTGKEVFIGRIDARSK